MKKIRDIVTAVGFRQHARKTSTRCEIDKQRYIRDKVAQSIGLVTSEVYKVPADQTLKLNGTGYQDLLSNHSASWNIHASSG